ncbi:hypothetical protein IGS67_03350 [Flavimobilis sp. GY10621]|uniref:Uncharacterized protein n=1 Tax=Flavimobilis rhizosphaerae TaxID=2775421 RepID=A0ABR9DQ42_9MICO|nr:hypothetical protein [Flavimobilis rhizosphaerae]MBD9698531.1 hypothetical protein [Flavimobilis rhizosphaerae]
MSDEGGRLDLDEHLGLEELDDRRLSRGTRSVIEDPIYTDSRTPQLMQMADHVAWCANASIAQVPKRSFAHDWYREYLSPRDPERAPRQL